jgi:integrase
VLAGAGLRRAEAAKLSVNHIQQRDGRWVIADLVRKHERIRTMPISGWCKVAIDVWREAAELHDGRVFRPLNRAGRRSGLNLPPEVRQTVKTLFAVR